MCINGNVFNKTETVQPGLKSIRPPLVGGWKTQLLPLDNQLQISLVENACFELVNVNACTLRARIDHHAVLGVGLDGWQAFLVFLIVVVMVMAMMVLFELAVVLLFLQLPLLKEFLGHPIFQILIRVLERHRLGLVVRFLSARTQS